MITSAGKSSMAQDMAHDFPIADLDGTGLPAPSVVRPIKVATIEPSRVIRRAGRVDAQLAAKVFSAIRSFIGR
jgi:mRNA interferase MazF